MKYGLILFLLSLALQVRAERRFSVSGVVLEVDRSTQILFVSHESIPGFMGAMAMPFHVRDARLFEGVQPGCKIEFTLVVTQDSSYIDHLEIRSFESLGQHPLEARRLQRLESLVALGQNPPPLSVGQHVPDFTLIDQNRNRVTLSAFTGRIVAIDFIYTRCPLPDYCVRLSNNFGQLQRRFSQRLGRDLVLLSVTFDPQHDQPEVLAKYANIWKAEPHNWHFLTGSLPDVTRLCHLFGVDSWADDGLLTHSLHTAIVDREGKLAVNIDGNQFTVQELGDLVEAQMGRAH
jgi:protein SCO1/2